MLLRKTGWFFFAFFAIVIGLYPLVYYVVNMNGKGLLSSKPSELLLRYYWKSFFYLHISFGGIALLTGWTQFSKKLRNKYLFIHRNIGKVYILSVLFSGTAGLYIAFFSTGGMVTHLGFGILAILWLITTIRAYTSIRKINIQDHERQMIRSYALCFAAVTLRLWLPLFQIVFHLDFISSYRFISWLCWIPNLALAELIIANKKKRTALQPFPSI